MLIDSIHIALWLSVPLLSVGAFVWWRKMALPLLACSVAAAIGIGLYRSYFFAAELFALPQHVGLADSCLILLLWLLFGQLIRCGGGIHQFASPRLYAAACGALMGDVAAALFLTPLGKDKESSARLVLAALGGSLIGRGGNAALLLQAEAAPYAGVALIPLAGLLVWMANPQKEELVLATPPPTYMTYVALVVATALLLVPQYSVWILLLAVMLLLPLVGRKIFDSQCGYVLLWGTGICILSVVATLGGLPELWAWGFEDIQTNYREEMPLMIIIGPMLAASLVDAQAMALIGQAFCDRAMDLRVEGVWFSLSAGTAIGGAGPLYLAGIFRQAFLRWLIQLLLGVVYLVGLLMIFEAMS